jgi:hypothetical protein
MLSSSIKFNLANKKGFSLGELVISIFVLLVGIVGVVGLVNSSIIHSADSRDAIIASELAQEGAELIRYIRDNNWANADTTVTTFDPLYFPLYSAVGPYYCTADKNLTYQPYSFPNILYCTASESGRLNDYPLVYTSGASPYYIHGGYHAGSGTATKFKRKIILEYNATNDPDYLTVKSIVIWGTTWPTAPNYSDCNIGRKCVLVEDWLYKRGLNL